MLLGKSVGANAGGNDWAVGLHEMYSEIVLIIRTLYIVLLIVRSAKRAYPLKPKKRRNRQLRMRVCGPEDARNSWHAVVCARAAIVRSWAHGCIPVPKGAKLSNNALFELRGMQATTSQTYGMRSSSKAEILCGQSGVFLISLSYHVFVHLVVSGAWREVSFLRSHQY